ncbi:MAG: hypothetical protein A3A80_03230 [Candidatus Terrybacteria bacterium RIFCSPLOWO2_01_FULL_44_24]|uniref:Peptidase M50 domain-containing protein n=1 Tax=Candidatus Terrybacteria bacterium RIFCSPHIGHO2_01_FULL_43_35 TaxID=1802361 RepID=A0A1G2PD09_9BACT|nr:MAG: hypothetical protein A2828_03385 [Candidatus Terrybacteria bacterium RIFCSPHIGHO2_01_FULL_43_35]OHA49439.1 MAG: hypothetical protein A3B75_03015 [Candidatus Terrybacteria bacterium RIFCSPHIGHO2_02_FULL_43_14]OHA51667.1 MAG: hypothetical protein A3A80_03230 [Candidatus Terrybacteria bacterium RIFCSPLOWO2_01_FULL_44_24]
MDITIVFQLLILLFSIVIHEVSHGIVALLLGDPTAKYSGRLTLNPLRHIDPVGTVLLPITLLILSGGRTSFGWAKPVPYNPHNLRNHKWGPAMVGVAGPLSNILLALFFGLTIRFGHAALSEYFTGFLVLVVLTNLYLAAFNFIPIPPLDGSKLLLSLLPSRIAETWGDFLERYGFFLLMMLIFFPAVSSILWSVLSIPISILFSLFTGLSF